MTDCSELPEQKPQNANASYLNDIDWTDKKSTQFQMLYLAIVNDRPALKRNMFPCYQLSQTYT